MIFKKFQVYLILKGIFSVLIFLLVIIGGCNNSTSDNQIDNNTLEESISNVDTTAFTKEDFNDSELKVLKINLQEPNSVGFISDSLLTWNPLSSFDTLKFKMEKIEGFLKYTSSKDTILFGPDTTLRELKLQSKKVQLCFNIQVGMKKKDFLKLMCSSCSRLSNYNEFENYDALGGLSYSKITFKSDTISHIYTSLTQ